MAIFRGFSGWTQVDDYRKERGSLTERDLLPELDTTLSE